MKDFTESYNVIVGRSSYWYDVSESLERIMQLVDSGEGMSREDWRALKQIRKVLLESSKITERQRNYHNRQLLRMRREHENES